MTTRTRTFRSGTVLLGGMGLLAASLAGCGSDPDKRCADPQTRKTLPDKECEDGGRGTYYWGGTVKNGKVSGGSFNKSAVDKGGFGGKSGSKGG